MDELAVYGLARSVAKDKAKESGQEGTPLLGFDDSNSHYEITTGDPFDLDEYNVPLAIIAPDTEFNLIVRKSNPEALHKLPKDKLRRALAQILDSV